MNAANTAPQVMILGHEEPEARVYVVSWCHQWWRETPGGLDPVESSVACSEFAVVVDSDRPLAASRYAVARHDMPEVEVRLLSDAVPPGVLSVLEAYVRDLLA